MMGGELAKFSRQVASKALHRQEDRIGRSTSPVEVYVITNPITRRNRVRRLTPKLTALRYITNITITTNTIYST